MSRRGTLKRDGGTWSLVVDVGPPGGARRQVRRRGFRTKGEAQDALTELLSSVRHGTFVTPRTQTFGDYLLRDWLPAIVASLERSTWVSYERNLRLHVVPRIGHVQLQRLDPVALNKLYAELLSGGRRDGKPGGLSARTVRYIASIVHRALKDAVQWRRLAGNPADAVRPPRPDHGGRHEMSTWSSDDVAEFLKLLEGDRYRCAFLVLATTGMRRGELLGLQWTDTDLDGGRVYIRRTVTAVRHRIEIRPRTKTGRGRAVDLDVATVGALRAHRAVQAQELLRLGLTLEKNSLVFSHADGKPYHPERFSREFDRRVERWGLRRIRLHDLRHTWATLALEAGVPIKVVSERLGHSTTAITLDIYSHVSPTMQAEAAERVARLMLGVSTTAP